MHSAPGNNRFEESWRVKGTAFRVHTTAIRGARVVRPQRFSRQRRNANAIP